MKAETKLAVLRALAAKPNDQRIYRESGVTGLTAILYETPWSVTFCLMLVLGFLAWWNGGKP